jgi:hypothetical protein
VRVVIYRIVLVENPAHVRVVQDKIRLFERANCREAGWGSSGSESEGDRDQELLTGGANGVIKAEARV